MLKKVACRKQNPEKSKNRQPPKYNLICILILFMPNIVFSRTFFSRSLKWTERKLWNSFKRPYSCPFIPNRTWNDYLYGEFPVYLVTVDRSSVQKISCCKARLKFIWHNHLVLVSSVTIYIWPRLCDSVFPGHFSLHICLYMCH